MKSAEVDLLGAALCGAYDALSEQRIDSVVVGGVALSYHLRGTPEIDHDIDLFIRDRDVDDAIEALEGAGFEVVRTHPSWLFKARLEGALVDVLYRLGRVVSFDDELLERAITVPIDGCSPKLVSREDLAVAQAGAGSSEVPAHWFEAVDLLRGAIDWSYLVRRGRAAPDRVISLLYYARSEGVEVPDGTIAALKNVRPSSANE